VGRRETCATSWAWSSRVSRERRGRASTEAFVANDLETALASLDPEIEWHATVGGIDEGQVAHGIDEVVKAEALKAAGLDSGS
jgi:hypothetical protein